jgi:hypothetical protein
VDRQAQPRGPHGAGAPPARLRPAAWPAARARGRLLAPKSGAALGKDPARLWQHVAERLPRQAKDAFARTATALVFVSAVAGRIEDEQLAAVLTAAGWSGQGAAGVHRDAVTSAAGHIEEVLEVMDAYSGRRSVADACRVLARLR